MLTVVKRTGGYKIRNVEKKKTYPTSYRSRASAMRKKKVMDHWFAKRMSRVG